MAIVSLAGLLKSSTVLWMLGISYNQPKEHRNTSPLVICHPSYQYEYKSCQDVSHFVTPPVPGESQPDFIGGHPFAYKFIHGASIDTVDARRMAIAKKVYEELNCTEYFKDYDRQYASLQEKDLIKFLTHNILPAISKEIADRDIDNKRALSCGVLSDERFLRGDK